MVTRRTVLAVATAALLAGCSSEDSAVAGLQKRYAAEAGVSSVTLSTFTPNEAVGTKNWRGDVAFSPSTTPEQQGSLIARFFEYAQSAGLAARDMSAISFAGPHGASVIVRFLMLDGEQSTEVATLVAAAPGASATIEVGSPLPSLRIASTVTRQEAMNVVRSVAWMANVPAAEHFTTQLSVSDHQVPYPYTVSADHHVGAAEARFAVVVQAWLASHPTVGFVLPFSSADNARIIAYTVADESAGIQSLARSAREAGIVTGIDGYLSEGGVPYLSIPRQ